MKKLTIFSLALIFAYTSCKKSTSTPPSIVGTWKITNISGTTVYKGSPGAEANTVSYVYANSILTETNSANSYLIIINSELWSFNNDGSFGIYENYIADTTSVSTADTITGWWDYTSSTIPNSNIVLRSLGTPNIVPIGGAFLIQSVSNTQLVLTVDESNVSSTGVTNKKDFTLTFSRQ